MSKLTTWVLTLHVLLLQVYCSHFWKGFDITNLPILEGQGYTFYDIGASKPQLLEQILFHHGMNLSRIRLNVTKSSLDRAVGLAKRFKVLGVQTMFDFHLSESWARPSAQAIPESWVDENGEPLKGANLGEQLKKYVTETLQVLSETGVDIAYVALGNEVSQGFLFPEGSIHFDKTAPVDVFGDFARLWVKAREGVTDFVAKSGKPSPRVMIHLNNGWSPAVSWFFDGLLATNIVTRDMVDTVGLSMYPYYNFNATLENLSMQMRYLEKKYQLPSMIVETAYPVSCKGNKPKNWSSGKPPFTPSIEGQLQWAKALRKTLAKNQLQTDTGMIWFEAAWMNKRAGGSHCEDLILFDTPEPQGDWHKAVARKSIDF